VVLFTDGTCKVPSSELRSQVLHCIHKQYPRIAAKKKKQVWAMCWTFQRGAKPRTGHLHLLAAQRVSPVILSEAKNLIQ
jgi:hypothetical protein